MVKIIKKISIITIVFLLFVFNSTIFARRGTGGPVYKGKYATYEWYYHYASEHPGYQGTDRLTLAIYDRKGNDSQIISEVKRLWGDDPVIKKYMQYITPQITCHRFGEIKWLNQPFQPEWDIEVQRNIGPIHFDWGRYQCNQAKWVDNVRLSYPRYPFPPNQCIGNSCMYSIPKKSETK